MPTIAAGAHRDGRGRPVEQAIARDRAAFRDGRDSASHCGGGWALNFDPNDGADPSRFAAVDRWRKALADGGAAASDPALMLDATCALFAVAVMWAPSDPAPACG